MPLIRITRNPIRPEAAIEGVRKKAYGVVIAYVGTVRDVSHDRRVIFMEHQVSLQDVARQELELIAEEIKRRWQLEDVSIIHRIGKLRTGEILLVVAIGAPHRVEAFEACQYAIDRFKEVSPKWTTETTEAV
jgi:molybdopterin synthase catalytic subunit